MRMNCPKCGRLLEEGELATSDGCMCCSTPTVSMQKNGQTNESISAGALLIGWIVAFGVMGLLIFGFFWLLGG